MSRSGPSNREWFETWNRARDIADEQGMPNPEAFADRYLQGLERRGEISPLSVAGRTFRAEPGAEIPPRQDRLL